MKEKIRSGFASLKPKQRALLVLMLLGVGLTAIGCASYISNSKKAPGQKVVKVKNDVVAMDTTLLDKNQLLEAQKDAQVAKNDLEMFKKEAETNKTKQLAAELLPPPPAGAPAKNVTQPQQQPQQGGRGRSASLPPLPQPGNAIYPPPPQTGMPASVPQAPAPPPRAVIEAEVGGISIINGVERKEEKSDDKKKDSRRTAFLPISYMEATLLSGLDAPTSGDAKGNPVPVLIRVKTPAVLPNDVKANLKGCFVVADGKGNLGTERAELVLVTLSCIDRKGRAVVDQALTGYVVDADGKAGLRGRVVTKMGAMITRTMIAGLFGGIGDVLTTANTTTSLSALGSVSQIKAGDMATAGLGKGLSSASKEIQKFYLELAHQTMPVVEIGAARPITLVLTKGVKLDIMTIEGSR